MLKICIEGS